MPPAVHGNSGPTLDGLSWESVLLLKGILASLVVDYVVRMKVSANLNWFYLATIPIPEWAGSVFANEGPGLVRSLNAVGADFPDTAEAPLVESVDRLSARLMLDALVADLFGLGPDDMRQISTRFPIYDAEVPAVHRYPRVAEKVFRALSQGGIDEARDVAHGAAEFRQVADVGFGFDALWVPEGGWTLANREAEAMLPRAPA